MFTSTGRQRAGTVSVEDFSHMVSAIHAAAITPQHWIEATEAIRETLGGLSAAMIIPDGSSRVIRNTSLPMEAQRAYNDYYRRLDYVLDAVECGPVGLIRGGEPLVALNARSEFNADWMLPHRMEDGLFVRLTAGSQPTCFLIAAAKEGPESFATTERIRVVDALIPHLQQALRTQRHLEDLVHRADCVAAAVDGIRHGVVAVGPGARVLHLNRAAERIVSAGDGPVVRSGVLRLTPSSLDAALHHSIVGALGSGEPPTCIGDSLRCPRSDGRQALVIHVLPYTAEGTAGGKPRALVLLIDPESQPAPSVELLRRLYGLTRAEAEVAVRITDGQGLQPIAEQLSLSTATIKTHLQRVFIKTGTHRQAQLVRLLLAIAP